MLQLRPRLRLQLRFLVAMDSHREPPPKGRIADHSHERDWLVVANVSFIVFLFQWYKNYMRDRLRDNRLCVERVVKVAGSSNESVGVCRRSYELCGSPERRFGNEECRIFFKSYVTGSQCGTIEAR